MAFPTKQQQQQQQQQQNIGACKIILRILCYPITYKLALLKILYGPLF